MKVFCRCSSHLQSVDFKLRKLPWIIWVGLILSVEDLKSKNWGFLKKEFCPKIITWKPWVSSLSAYPTDFRFASLHSHRILVLNIMNTHKEKGREREREYLYNCIYILSILLPRELWLIHWNCQFNLENIWNFLLPVLSESYCHS